MLAFLLISQHFFIASAIFLVMMAVVGAFLSFVE